MASHICLYNWFTVHRHSITPFAWDLIACLHLTPILKLLVICAPQNPNISTFSERRHCIYPSGSPLCSFRRDKTRWQVALMCLHTVNVPVVFIVLHVGPDRRCLATCLQHGGASHDVQLCRCSRGLAAHYGGLSKHSERRELGKAADRQTNSQKQCLCVCSYNHRVLIVKKLFPLHVVVTESKSTVLRAGTFVCLADVQAVIIESVD